MVSRDSVIEEKREVYRDLLALKKAKSVLLERVEEMTPQRKDTFLSWAVMQIVMNAFVVAIVRCEGLLEDYRTFLESHGDAQDNVVELHSRRT